jgi:hypothetical protein
MLLVLRERPKGNRISAIPVSFIAMDNMQNIFTLITKDVGQNAKYFLGSHLDNNTTH